MTDNYIKFASTYQYKLEDSDWNKYVNRLILPYYSPQPHSVLDEFKKIFIVFRQSLRHKYMLLSSTSGRFHPDLLTICLLSFVPRRLRPHIAIAGDMWQPNSGLRNTIERLLIKIADRAIDRYFVQTSDELTLFPELWGINPQKARVLLYHYSLTEADLAVPAKRENYVFSGGNSHRDYLPLIEAARQLPEVEFFIATSRLSSEIDLPPNVTARPTSHDEFVAKMRNARIVAVPMKKGMQRGVGQQTYLNAMLLGKPTLVTNVLGVADHMNHEKDGFIVDGTPEEYVDLLRWLYAEENQLAVDAICAQAKIQAQKFSYAAHLKHLMALMDEFIKETSTD